MARSLIQLARLRLACLVRGTLVTGPLLEMRELAHGKKLDSVLRLSRPRSPPLCNGAAPSLLPAPCF